MGRDAGARADSRAPMRPTRVQALERLGLNSECGDGAAVHLALELAAARLCTRCGSAFCCGRCSPLLACVLA